MSFMKKVAKVAAPFASLIPGVGPLIGVGLGALGSIGGGGGKQDKTMQQQMLAQQQQLLGAIGTQQKMSQGLIDKGSPLVDQGAGFANDSLGFFKQLLSGGSKSSQVLAGPISDLRSASSNALQNVSKFAPRSAMAGSFVDRTNQLGSSIARLRSDSMFGAAQNLLSGGSSLLGAGSNLMTGGVNANSSVMQALLGMRGQDISRDVANRQMSSQNMSGLGEGIGSLLGILLGPGGLLNKGGGGGGGGGGTWGSFKLPPILGGR